MMKWFCVLQQLRFDVKFQHFLNTETGLINLSYPRSRAIGEKNDRTDIRAVTEYYMMMKANVGRCWENLHQSAVSAVF